MIGTGTEIEIVIEIEMNVLDVKATKGVTTGEIEGLVRLLQGIHAHMELLHLAVALEIVLIQESVIIPGDLTPVETVVEKTLESIPLDVGQVLPHQGDRQGRQLHQKPRSDQLQHFS